LTGVEHYKNMIKEITGLKKAYKNLDFLNSRDGRIIRIISEFIEPMSRFGKLNVKDTIVFFGSARIKPVKESVIGLKKLEKMKASRNKIDEAIKNVEFSRYYNEAEELAYLLTHWSEHQKPPNRFVICSGGGSGIMEAANRGAKRAKGLSIGLNISLPMEQNPNPYITDSLNFEFHYFFMRKFWFAYLAKSLVVFPGGFGTMDELFEILTLVQTSKIRKKMPVVIYGEEFWKKIINFNELYKSGMISKKDTRLLKFANTPNEAFEFIKAELSKNYINNPSSLFNSRKKKS
jgi:uncharacterized protein (TIGR00730 family)